MLGEKSKSKVVKALISFLAVLLIYNCSDNSTEIIIEAEGDPRIEARPKNPVTEIDTGKTELGISTNRDGYIYVPEEFNVAEEYPLLVLLHGNGSDADWWLTLSDWADSQKVVLLAVDSRLSSWDLKYHGFYNQDVRFIDKALNFVFERCKIDSKKIGLAGISDGATYSLCLGTANGGLFTHVIAYAPEYFLYNESTPKPKVFVYHGTSDYIFPVSFSRDVIVPKFNEYGFDITYYETGGGHGPAQDVYNESLTKWFLER